MFSDKGRFEARVLRFRLRVSRSKGLGLNSRFQVSDVSSHSLRSCNWGWDSKRALVTLTS